MRANTFIVIILLWIQTTKEPTNLEIAFSKEAQVESQDPISA